MSIQTVFFVHLNFTDLDSTFSCWFALVLWSISTGIRIPGQLKNTDSVGFSPVFMNRFLPLFWYYKPITIVFVFRIKSDDHTSIDSVHSCISILISCRAYTWMPYWLTSLISSFFFVSSVSSLMLKLPTQNLSSVWCFSFQFPSLVDLRLFDCRW